ncbi:MAG TPA: SRPBCC domain-containing protein, partial [Acidimicrobiales bacterium]|nr:SRPBCC domain-containing protein [Acidimicrobiales bacterium]
MELSNEFRVSVPPEQAWKVLNDPERIAPMLPGAQLQEIEGEELRGIVKVKVGPITAQYKGTARFSEQDESAHRVVMKASGRDTRGQGNANATITASLTPDGDGTRVTVVTDLTITGKVAQFGRGVLADVSAKLMGQFADALEADLLANGTGSPPAGEPAAGATGGAPTAGEPPTATTGAAPASGEPPTATTGAAAGAGTSTTPGPDDAVPEPGPSGAGAFGADLSGPGAPAAGIPGADAPAPPASNGAGAAPAAADAPSAGPAG